MRDYLEYGVGVSSQGQKKGVKPKVSKSAMRLAYGRALAHFSNPRRIGGLGRHFNPTGHPSQPKPFSLRTATRRTFSTNTDEVGWGEGKEHLKTVTLIGRPNVGKSRLFNRFVGKRVAIVNDEPGTTRDFREAVGTVADLNFNIVDTAGLEDRQTR